MKMNGSIYGLIDSNTMEVRYIGQTVGSLKDRLAKHLRDSRKQEWHVSRWIRGLRGLPVILPLEKNVQSLNEAELNWIAKIRGMGGRLCNLTDGGSGACGFVFTDEQRAKVSKGITGRPVSIETRAKISVANKGKRPWLGRHHSLETRQKISVGHTGKMLSEAHKAAISASVKGKPHTAEHNTAIRAGKQKKRIEFLRLGEVGLS